MKQYSYNIGKWDIDDVFAPIRTKTECIKLLMKTLKIITSNQEVHQTHAGGKMQLIISKMSRVFYFSDNKYFSINFPFMVREIDNGIYFSTTHVPIIDNQLTSLVLATLNSESSLDSHDYCNFFEPIMEASDDNAHFWPLLRDLLIFEEGYIRYDYDEKYENKLLHPRNHYDVFYSSNNTFKLGIDKRISEKELIDLLSTESNCHFVSQCREQ